MWKIFVKEKEEKSDEKMEEKKTGVWQDWDVSGKNYDRWGKFGMQHIDDNLLEKVLQGRSTNDVIKWFLTFGLYYILQFLKVENETFIHFILFFITTQHKIHFIYNKIECTWYLRAGKQQQELRQ